MRSDPRASGRSMLRVRIASLTAVVLLLAGSCRGERDIAGGAGTESSGVKLPDRWNLGHPATPAQLARLDIDANPSGVGLPPGRGTYAAGAITYRQQCAMCHGMKGEGLPPFPPLVGAEPRDSFPFGRNAALPKTIGNYWPYATTLYDYIHRAMPYNAPGSLTPDQVYGLVAYLLAENGVTPKTLVIDAKSLPGVKMPARRRFVPDDRQGGAEFR